LGLLRLLVLPDRTDLLEPTAAALFDAAEAFWRANKIGQVKAYHLSTGYPTFQAGAGMLPGDWAEQVRLLTARGFRFAERFYCLARTLDQLFEEAVPQGGLNLAFRGTREDRRYQVFFRRTELIAEARLLQRPRASEGSAQLFGYIAHWAVDERWRNQHIGRWLLRRMINDATQQGMAELVIHVQAQHYAAMNLLAQHGFIEQNYRGYSFELSLTA
jgi:ribosomal protein S18 acetylase RimI-like enzyme